MYWSRRVLCCLRIDPLGAECVVFSCNEGDWFRRPWNDPMGASIHGRTDIVRGRWVTQVCLAEDVCHPLGDMSRRVERRGVVFPFLG